MLIHIPNFFVNSSAKVLGQNAYWQNAYWQNAYWTKRLLTKRLQDIMPTVTKRLLDIMPTGHNAYWTKCLPWQNAYRNTFRNVNIRKKYIKTIFRIIDLLKKIIGHSNKSLSIKVIHCDWKLFHELTTILRIFHILQYGNQISSSSKVGSWVEAWIPNLG